MIKLTNIKKEQDIISVNVESTECKPSQKYKLSFNAISGNILSDITGLDKFDISKIVYKLSSYVEKGQPLPESDCIVCF
jgi:hypothetical protein